RATPPVAVARPGAGLPGALLRNDRVRPRHLAGRDRADGRRLRPHALGEVGQRPADRRLPAGSGDRIHARPGDRPLLPPAADDQRRPRQLRRLPGPDLRRQRRPDRRARRLQAADEPPESRGHWKEVRAGFALVLGSRALLAVFVSWNLVMLANAGVNVSEVVLAKVSFNAGSFGFGLLWAGSGVGFVV